MQAAVLYGPSDVRLEETPEPGIPAPNEVLLKVSLAALCGTDASQFLHPTMIPLDHAHPVSGHTGPTILGHEMVGVIIAKGAQVTHLEVGSRVVPGAGWWCGACPQCRAGRINICIHYYLYGIQANGGLAEQVRVPAAMCVPVPDTCSDEAAAMAQPCAVALHALSRAKINGEHTVALFGAGSIGSLLLACLQAQTIRPRQLIVVDVESHRLAQAQILGATAYIDASKQEASAAILALTAGHGVDVAIEATGVPSSIVEACFSVTRGGHLVQVGIPSEAVSLPLAHAVVREITITTSNGEICTSDLPRALALLSTTHLAAHIGYQVIALKDVVECGLIPLTTHTADRKILVMMAS